MPAMKRRPRPKSASHIPRPFRRNQAAAVDTSKVQSLRDKRQQFLRRRGIYLLPNAFTTAALFCGFFGEQFDSLSDMVSFGVAPALVIYEWILRDLGRWGWLAAFVYCAGAALRLARFNANNGVVDKRFFQG